MVLDRAEHGREGEKEGLPRLRAKITEKRRLIYIVRPHIFPSRVTTLKQPVGMPENAA